MNSEKQTTPAQRMLIADDKAGVRDLLAKNFTERGFEVATAANGDEAASKIAETDFDIVITDMRMPGKDGIGVLRAAKEKRVETQVIVITAFGTIETAVEAMRLGAYDFVLKPFKLAEIELKVDRIAREGDGRTGVIRPRTSGDAIVEAEAKKPASVQGATSRIVGASTQSSQVISMIRKLGPSKSSVLITGPSGVGKELVAREIHECSDRSDKPFVALNCAALAPGVLESELFGHERGAFTGASGKRIGRFERAHTGTLFLDEVGEISPNIQTKLLRVLQEGEFERVGGTESVTVDVRIVAATNRDLVGAIKQGLFREDFYYRLKVFSLNIVPLCERRDDIPALIEHFIAKYNREAHKSITGVDQEVHDLFMHYAWPGNVREMENTLERAIVLAEGDTITRNELPPEMFTAAVEPVNATKSKGLPDASSLLEKTDQLESELIYGALERFRWNKTKAAEHLGIKRTTLQYKIKKYNLE
jgi:two-component system NtrC family response regulator